MFTYPNFISLLRIPLAFVFLQENPFYRALAIVTALLTDGLDGYVARRFNQRGRFGTVLDPFADKFFVFFILVILIGEHRISLPEALILISRDFSVILYGFYLALRKRLFAYKFRAIWCGKITTVLQFAVLLCLSFGLTIPPYLYGLFILLGVLALAELYRTDKLRRQELNIAIKS
jgi:CDP-diacylglycerol--glycerol-3-phosphate 3-phosphatidyltransferase